MAVASILALKTSPCCLFTQWNDNWFSPTPTGGARVFVAKSNAIVTMVVTIGGQTRSCEGYAVRAVSLPGRSGGGVLDRPTIEKATPGRESEFDLRKTRKLSPPYRVMLHNDSYNKREYVVQVLMKVIPGMSVDNAVNIMQEAHVNGLAVVIICTQVDAEEHCLQLRSNGLLSSIEPATGGC